MLQPAGKILVVAHDEMSFLLRHILESEGFKTIVSRSVDGVLDVLGLETINLIILDEGLLAVSGDSQSCYCDFIGRWAAPALILGGNRHAVVHATHIQPGQKIDVMAKPIFPQELLRRIRGFPSPQRDPQPAPILVFADVELNTRTQRIYRNGRSIAVSPLEFRLLHHLMRSPSEVFSREALLKAAWPSDVFVEPRTVDVHMGKLRRSLNQHGGPNLIRTVHCRGYSLDLED
jgi:two-component system phosphate regulon response regulator PhoB